MDRWVGNYVLCGGCCEGSSYSELGSMWSGHLVSMKSSQSFDKWGQLHSSPNQIACAWLWMWWAFCKQTGLFDLNILLTRQANLPKGTSSPLTFRINAFHFGFSYPSHTIPVLPWNEFSLACLLNREMGLSLCFSVGLVHFWLWPVYMQEVPCTVSRVVRFSKLKHGILS